MGGDDAFESHVRTLIALRSRDPDLIDEVMDEHLRYLEEVWEAQGGLLRFRRVSHVLLSSR